MLTLKTTIRAVLLPAVLIAVPALAAEDNAFTNALEEILGRAESAIDAGEPQLAESEYRLALLDTWMQLAMLEVASGDLPAARDALLESTRSAASGERRSHSSLALVQLWLGETDEALEHLRYLAKRHPKNTQVRQLLAQALLAAGRFEEAGEQLDDMRQRLPKVVASIEAYRAKFEAREQAAGEQADWPARREAFLPAPGGGAFEGLAPAEIEAERVRLRATQVRVYRNLAMLHDEHPACAKALLARAAEIGGPRETWRQAAYGTADLDMRRLEEIQPLRADATALWQNAKVEHLPVMRLVNAGELRAAENELRAVLKRGDDPVARDMLGVLLAHRGQIEAAREHFAAVAANAPDFLPARQHLLRLDLLADTPDPEAISSELRALAELGPLERDLELELAAIELAAGEIGAGRRRLFDAAHRFNSPKAFLRLVDVLAEQGELQDSVKYAIKAMRLAPDSEEVLATYARAAHRAGQAGSALGAIEPLVRLYPQVAEYRFLHGVAVADRDPPTAGDGGAALDVDR